MSTNVFSFNGRIRRSEYVLSFIGYVIAYVIITASMESEGLEAIILLYIPLLWFLWAQGAKRCHDIGKSGWWQLVPFYMLWMIFEEGQRHTNEYGPDPKNVEQTVHEDRISLDKEDVSEKPVQVAVDINQGQEEFKMGLKFYNGSDDIAEQSFAKAVTYFKQSATKGHPQAAEILANCYYNGDGVEQSYENAVELWERLAQEGNTNAQYNLGLCYYQGKGVEKNNETAISLLRPACENLNDNACSLLNRIKKETDYSLKTSI
ncbi:DUF805 domain-containing protein [Kaistella sp. PBT33-4]|uniref:DUF805 domain-containing protein n=1 Tax=Kaistella sp. PBT33-4 TaxID=3032000 RepID=UPI0023D7F2E3|nr:DUF805 domain-containing protein [Kaistella sp. PBT33-4]MDF0718596.1 DUF805 domain-containing protein [Kaistella sp. PBT33-4]